MTQHLLHMRWHHLYTLLLYIHPVIQIGIMHVFSLCWQFIWRCQLIYSKHCSHLWLSIQLTISNLLFPICCHICLRVVICWNYVWYYSCPYYRHQMIKRCFDYCFGASSYFCVMSFYYEKHFLWLLTSLLLSNQRIVSFASFYKCAKT